MDHAEAKLEPQTDWEEVDRITDEAIATGDSIPWEVVKAWLKSWDGRTRVPSPN